VQKQRRLLFRKLFTDVLLASYGSNETSLKLFIYFNRRLTVIANIVLSEQAPSSFFQSDRVPS